MKTISVFLALSALGTYAKPNTIKRDGAAPATGDTDILNYALSLEQLQSAFYTEALARFDEQAFNQSGYSPDIRSQFVLISEQEQAHVGLLNQTLGSNASQPCNYTFPYTDVPSFVAFSQLLEGVGTSAYIGSVQNITNATLLTVASTILATEARQSAWVNSAVANKSAWSGPFDTPLTPRQVITILTPFITSCPPTNLTPPFSAFPALTVSAGLPGSNVTFSYTANGTSGGNSTPGAMPTPTSNTTSPSSSIDASSTVTDPVGTAGADPSGPTDSVVPTDSEPSTSADGSVPTDLTSSAISPTDVPNSGVRRRDSNTTFPTPTSNSTSPSNSTVPSTQLYAAFLSGLVTQFAPITDGNATLPAELKGQVYAVVTNNNTVVTDDNIIAGPTVLNFDSDMQSNITSGNQTA